jgi:hypothetical protein
MRRPLSAARFFSREARSVSLRVVPPPASKPEGSEPLPAPPRLTGQVWDLMTDMVGEMLNEAETSVKLRRVDLDAFDRKLAELSGGGGKAAEQNLNRLSERRASLEEEITALEKHVDDLRFLGNSLEKLKGESQSRDKLQNEAMNQIKIIEDARAVLEVQVHQLKRARQELADVIEVITGVAVQAPPAPALPVTAPSEESVELPAGEGEDIAFD